MAYAAPRAAMKCQYVGCVAVGEPARYRGSPRECSKLAATNAIGGNVAKKPAKADIPVDNLDALLRAGALRRLQAGPPSPKPAKRRAKRRAKKK